MYGWRGRIGLMIPYDNAVLEPEFNRTLPAGVSAHVVRSTKTDRKDLAEESIGLAKAMVHLRLSIALYACNASSFNSTRPRSVLRMSGLSCNSVAACAM